MEIPRDKYLQKLIDRKWNGMVKVITGIRRCGKTYLVFNLFKNHLLSTGVDPSDIVEVRLDTIEGTELRDPWKLYEYITSRCQGERERYVLIDEIQFVKSVQNPNVEGDVITFYEVLNGLLGNMHLDVYVTGSNSKMLSTDIFTQFRGRGDEVRVHPLSFAEFYSARGGDRYEAYKEYEVYGGMPQVFFMSGHESKSKHLADLFETVYLRDVAQRYGIEKGDVLESVANMLCSNIGSLTNPSKIAKSVSGMASEVTARRYLGYLKDAFLFSEAKRFDVKGRRYFSYPVKYYCEDIGLRNARIGFRQTESTHIMENIIYNELVTRGFDVDVGVMIYNTKDEAGSKRVPKEIDFVANRGNRRIYIQSAFAMDDPEKREKEVDQLCRIKDGFAKVVVRMDVIGKWYDDDGILNINLLDFLLDPDCI